MYKYLVEGIVNVDERSRGAMKHKIQGYQLFKEHYVKKVSVKDNVCLVVKGESTNFLIRCNVAAAMKRNVYQVYIHLCQKSGKVLYAKCSRKAGACGCCKHAAASLYQLVDFKELNLKSVTDDKTCTELLQKWHVPGEKENTEAILFS